MSELKALGKPFVMVLNSRTPENADTRRLRDSLSEKYDVPVLLLNVQKMELSDVHQLLESVLFEFPLTEVYLDMPGWMSALPEDHWLNQSVLEAVTKAAGGMSRVRDHEKLAGLLRETPYAGEVTLSGIQLNAGEVDYRFTPRRACSTKFWAKQAARRWRERSICSSSWASW